MRYIVAACACISFLFTAIAVILELQDIGKTKAAVSQGFRELSCKLQGLVQPLVTWRTLATITSDIAKAIDDSLDLSQRRKLAALLATIGALAGLAATLLAIFAGRS